MATKAQMQAELLQAMSAPVEDIQHVTGIIYGDNGGGKTVTAVKLAQAVRESKGGKILFVDAVNAWRSLKNHPELLNGVIRMRYDGKVMLDTLIDAIEEGADGFTDFSVIILDEMSSMTDRDGDLVLSARSKADKSKDPDVLTQPDMGATTERMRRTVVKLLQQPVSVIFVAHMREDEDKAKGYKVIRPRFMPKFSGTIREGLDFVGYMSCEVGKRDGANISYNRSIQVHPTKTVVAKTRIGGLRLSETPDDFVRGVIKWLNGNETDSTVSVVVDDTVPNVDEDFAGYTVDE